MKNILHVIDHLGLGGAQTIVRDLVEKNSTHRIFALRGAENEVKFSEENKKKVTILKSKSKYDITPVFALKKEIKKHSIDVIHVHLSRGIFIVYLYKLLFGNSISVIVNEHGAVFAPQRWFYRFLLRRMQRYTKCFIAVSEKIKESLIADAKIKPEKIQVVYNFIDFEELRYLTKEEKDSLRKTLNLEQDDFVIGFAGRLHGVKFVNTLIDSYKYFKDDKTKILIIGDGDEFENLKAQSKDEKNIIFLGFRNDIKKLYQILDVIALPSRSEASPMAFYESQVYGIPFIGSNVYAINEFISDGFNGLLFKFMDEKDLADKIIKIRSNKELREKISKNALENLSKYDIKLYNRKLEQIYA
jgi:glycosyltransferase involved in cell wall biosynthesis